MGVERKTRRALGDIGNMVTIRGVDGKPLPQVSRPVTRSFCAKLLANAEAQKSKNLAANVNGPIVVDGPRQEKKPVARNPVQKKAVVKPKPKQEVVIEISPDTTTEEALEKEKLKEKVGEKSRKKAPTLTSTLTARSKVG